MRLWLFAFLFSSLSLAQAATYEFSQEQRLTNKLNRFRLVGRNLDGYVVRMYGRLDVLDLYDTGMRRIASQPIQLEGQYGLLQHIVLQPYGSNLLYLSSRKRATLLLAQRVNSKFQSVGTPLVIDSLPDGVELVEENIRFRSSLDQSKQLMYYPVFDTKGVESIWLCCMQDDMQVLWRRRLLVNKPEEALEQMRVLVSNGGAVTLVLYTQSTPREAVAEIHHVAADGSYNGMVYTLPKPLYGELYADIDQSNEQLILAGLFDEMDDNRRERASNGYFYTRLNPQQGTVEKEYVSDYGLSFLQELTGKDPDKLPKKLFTFSIKKIIPRMDGGALILAESLLRDSRETLVPGFQPGMNSFRTVNIYQYNDIIAFSIDSSGKTEWSRVMRKKQISEDDEGYYSSFFIVNRGMDLQLLFLDEPVSGSTLSTFSLSAGGQVQRQTLLDQSDWDVFLVNRQTRQTGPGELIMPSVKGDAFRLMRLTF